jgi:hypothetical protein
MIGNLLYCPSYQVRDHLWVKPFDSMSLSSADISVDPLISAYQYFAQIVVETSVVRAPPPLLSNLTR